MAATAMYTTALPGRRAAALDLRALLGLVVCAGLPMGLFGLVNLGAESLGVMPLFFAPFGLPGWVGGAAHLVQLGLLGVAFWALLRRDAQTAPKVWLALLIAAYIVLPYVTPPLDSLQLSLVCSMLFLFGLATLRRAGETSALAGWLMLPMLGILGFSAVMGLVLTAAYTPPFALIQGQNPAPAAS